MFLGKGNRLLGVQDVAVGVAYPRQRLCTCKTVALYVHARLVDREQPPTLQTIANHRQIDIGRGWSGFAGTGLKQSRKPGKVYRLWQHGNAVETEHPGKLCRALADCRRFAGDQYEPARIAELACQSQEPDPVTARHVEIERYEIDVLPPGKDRMRHIAVGRTQHSGHARILQHRVEQFA